MPRKRAIRVRCPICRKFVKNAAPEFPFCSERCRAVDLGKWASGAYVVSTPAADEDRTPEKPATSEDQE